MTDTPDFPAWRHRLGPMGARTAQALRQVRAHTLCQLEACLGQWLPAGLLPKAAAGAHSRDRDYTCERTFWGMLWQSLQPGAAGRAVVRQLQALFQLAGGRTLSEEDGAYCRAKARLRLADFPPAVAGTAQAADRLAPDPALLGGRRLLVVDGTALTLADTPRNRKAYPPLQCAPAAVSFPMLRLVTLFSLVSGAIHAAALGSLGVSELALFHALSAHLKPGDILLGDRGFGYYPVVAFLHHHLQVDFLGRTTRRIDGRRRTRRLGPGDWLIAWTKKLRPTPWLSAQQWAALPATMTLRAVRGRCQQKGFRTRQVTVVTTLLDPELYPAQEILTAYLRRWRLEMCLDDLKTSLQLETLRGRSPEMVQKEVYVRLIGHNLLRCTMAQAARDGGVPLERISFKGSLDALREFAQAMAQARSQRQRRQLWAELLRTLAADLVPERPGRREPRAVKRVKHKYPRLNCPRGQFRDPPKRNVRRKLARLRKLGLM